MPELEARYPCPVCLGVKLTKIQPAPEQALLLDYCARCGGIWFDKGEVGRLRQCRPQALWSKVTVGAAAHRMPCHSCLALMPRNEPRCPACGWRNEISCPVCGVGLEPQEYNGLRLDACRRCQGVWFDNVELAEIWNLKVTALSTDRRPAESLDGDHFFLGDVLFPFPVPTPGVADALPIPDTLAGGADGIAEIAGRVVEATGSLAGSVFDSIAGIVGDIFDGDFDGDFD